MPDLNLGDLTITSPDFDAGGAMPPVHSAEGGNQPPQLAWRGVPDDAQELVLMVHDPDAPLLDGFTHWAVHGITPQLDGVKDGLFEAPDVTVDRNSMGEDAYMGPAPPPGHGPHHYFFHLYALDTSLPRGHAMSRAELLEHMDGHIIEQARVVGTFER
jgi:Raf kinase inhibitor-like YbhB/YbcL family protein